MLTINVHKRIGENKILQFLKNFPTQVFVNTLLT